MDKTDHTKLTWSDLWRAAQVPLQFVGEHRQTAILLAFLAFISAIMGAAVPYAVGRFVDALIAISQGTNMTGWLVPLGIWFGVVFVAAIVDWRLNIISSRMGNFIYASAAHRWYSALLFFPTAFHKQKKGGETLNKISRAAGQISQLVENILLSIGPQIISMFIGVGFAYVIEPHLAIVIIIGMSVYGVASLYTALPIA